MKKLNYKAGFKNLLAASGLAAMCLLNSITANGADYQDTKVTTEISEKDYPMYGGNEDFNLGTLEYRTNCPSKSNVSYDKNNNSNSNGGVIKERKKLTLERIIGGSIITDVCCTKADCDSEKIRILFDKYGVGGVIFFTGLLNFGFKNQFTSKEDIIETINRITALADYLLIKAVDVEGGKVNRFKESYPLLSAKEIGQKYLKGEINLTDVEQYCKENKAQYLKSCGFNMNLDPVLDVDDCSGTGFIDKAGRSYGCNQDLVSLIGNACIKGMQEAGIAAVAKHYPGLGKVPLNLDTHKDCSARLYDLGDRDVFFDAIRISNVSSIMTAHAHVSWCNDEIASKSKCVVDEIRKINPNQSIMSDDFGISCLGMDFSKGYDSSRVAELIEHAYQSYKAGHNFIILRNMCHPEEIVGGFINRVMQGINDGEISMEHVAKMYAINQKFIEDYVKEK
jgi:beta-glucosidase-like glycosyl hydrolase